MSGTLRERDGERERSRFNASNVADTSGAAASQFLSVVLELFQLDPLYHYVYIRIQCETCRRVMNDGPHNDAPEHVAIASKAIHDGDLALAISELVIASESYVEQLQFTTDKECRRSIFACLNKCTKQAERLKAQQKEQCPHKEGSCSHGTTNQFVTYCRNGPARQHSRSSPSEPVKSNVLSKKEQLVLLRSSKIGERAFPIWNQNNIPVYLNRDQPFHDETSIFPEQWTFIKRYARIIDVISEPILRSDQLELHTNLSQVRINDCSLVASLIVAFQWSQRFQLSLLTKGFYPRSERGPVLNPHGKYLLRVFLNGTQRLLEIDDRIPLGEDGKYNDVLIFPTNLPQVVTPALMQKAFWKVAGTKFKGSDSASDLHLLIGWLPERLLLRGATRDSQAIWSQLYQSWNFGDILITLGTGSLTKDAEADLGLVSEHNYAVIGLEEAGEEKTVVIQNPWKCPSEQVRPVQDTSIFYKTTFRLEFSQILQQFEMLFMNWNTSLYRHIVTSHFAVNSMQFSITDQNLSACPQIVLVNTSQSAISIFILLTRHRQQVIEDSEATSATYTTLALYDSHGTQLTTPTNLLKKTDHQGCMELSLRCTIPPRIRYTLVICQRNPLPIESMTLNVYHAHTDAALEFSTPINTFPHRDALSSEWAGSGGPPTLRTFSRNPQFLMTVATTTLVKVIVESPGVDVNLDITHSHVRPLKIDKTTIIVSGKGYCRDHQSITATMQPGSYSIIPSTYKPNQTAAYKLSWFSQSPVTVQLARPLGSGQLRKVSGSHWSREIRTQKFAVTSVRQNSITVHVHPFTQRIMHSVTLSLHDAPVANVKGRGGLGLEKVNVSGQKTYILICEMLESGKEGAFEVELYSDGAVSVARM